MNQPLVYLDFLATLDEVAPSPPSPPTPANDNPVAPSAKVDLAGDEEMYRYLIEKGVLDPGSYDDWIEIGMALKSTHGEAGFSLWHAISAEAAGYDGEADCRAKWESFRPPADRKPITTASHHAKAKELGWKPPRAPDSRGRGSRKSGRPDPARVAEELALELGHRPFLNPEGVAHVTLVPADTGEDHREIHVVLDSAIYRSELSALYADAQPGKVLSKEQCTLAMGLLAHRARKVDKQKLYCRSALRDGALYIDRGTPDGQCIKVSAAEISTITNPPIPFLYRGEKYAALPLPEFGGSVQDFARHFNVNKEDLITLIAFILVALFGAEAYPILLIQGLQGSGKSTLMDMVRALIDPTVNRKDGRATFCNKEHDLFIAASSRQVLCFDNISIVDQAASDALCRMSTGGSLSTRKYYSDSDEKAFTACRPVMATAIGSPTKRGDFLDRCVMVTAQHLDKRRTERRIWDDFERDRPKLFGFLLTALQMAMQNLDRIEAEMDEGKYSKHRMAELTALVEAAASMLGLERGEFSARQDKAQQLMQAESAMGDSFILAIHDHLSRHPAIDVLELTARELLNKIQPDYPPKGWPHTNQVKRIFQRNGAGLAAIGLQVDFVNPEGHANIFRYRITRTELFQASDVNTIPIKLPF